MLPLLHIGDVHLGAPFSSFGDLAPQRRGAQEEAFRSLPRLVARSGAEALLVAGDLFDGPRPEGRLVALVRETFRRLLEANVPVFAVPGNHDRHVGAGWPYEEMPDGVVVFRDPRFGAPATAELPGGTLHVYGLAYDAAREPRPLASYRRLEADGYHVVLLHAGLTGDPRWTSGHALRVSRDELAGLSADYVALGDYHRFRPPTELDPTGGVAACYCGSFVGLDSAETGRKGAARVSLKPNRAPAVELEPAGVSELVDVPPIDVSGCLSDVEVAEHVARAAAVMIADDGIERYPRVKVAGHPEFPVDPERVLVELRERFGFALLEDATRYFDSSAVRGLAAEPSIAGHVARLGIERLEGAADETERRLHERALRLALRALEVVR